MKKIIALCVIALLLCALSIPAFAASPDRVRFALYDDCFIYDGEQIDFSAPSGDYVPSFMYLSGDKLYIVFRRASASPYVLVDRNGILTYFDETNSVQYIYTVSPSVAFQRSVTANRLDSPSDDLSAFQSCFIVSLHDIYCYSSYNGGALFRKAEPVIYFDDITDDPDGDEPVDGSAIIGFFSALFEGLSLIVAVSPILYLFGILVLAFIIFIFKMIFRH